MPVSDQANQMTMLQQAMQQMQAQQQMQAMIKQMMSQGQGGQAQPAAAASPTGQGQGLAALLGGAGAPLGQAQQNQQPPTLGVNQPIPMQMPQADPQGQQQQTPIDPMALSGAGPQ